MVTVADLVDGGDPEAVSTEGVESELDVINVSHHFCPLRPTPELLLLVLLLLRPHHKLWEDMDAVFPVVTLYYFLLKSKLSVSMLKGLKFLNQCVKQQC